VCLVLMSRPFDNSIRGNIVFGIGGMTVWNDHDRWAALCSELSCPICCRNEPLDLVATLEASWVTMQEAAPVRGYVCLVSRTHAVELHDIPEAAACAFMRDARRVSRALVAATGAVKLNYEIHGNSLPHLHMHFFPRYRGDCFEGQPINPRLVVQPVYVAGEFHKTRDTFLRALTFSVT
jgi:diadenosine tetraphosphate (Ap4A) HIT family hydrolase